MDVIGTWKVAMMEITFGEFTGRHTAQECKKLPLFADDSSMLNTRLEFLADGTMFMHMSDDTETFSHATTWRVDDAGELHFDATFNGVQADENLRPSDLEQLGHLDTEDAYIIQDMITFKFFFEKI